MTRGWHVFQARWLLPFEYQTLKGLVFECVRYSNRNIIYREIWGAFDRGDEHVSAILWKTRLVQRLPDLVKYWRNRTWNKTSEYWIFKNLNSKCLVFKCSYHSNTRHLFVHFRQSFWAMIRNPNHCVKYSNGNYATLPSGNHVSGNQTIRQSVPLPTKY